jgi:ubiquinone/menaquinone biosynthesis C-methylase UbiE
MQTYFDTAAAVWDENPVHRDRNRAIAGAILDSVKPKRTDTALEYGAGTGLLARELASRLGSIVLADSSAGMVEEARKKIAASGLRNLSAVKLDLETDALPAERFSLLYTSMTLHHVRDVDGILPKFAALLKPGGWVAIADLVLEDGSFHDPDADVHYGFDPAVLSENLKRLDLTEASFRTVYSVVRNEKAYPMFLLTARKPG